MNISPVCRALIAVIFIVQMHYIPALHLGKKYFRRSVQLANAITPLDDVLCKTNFTMGKLDQIIQLVQKELKIKDVQLKELVLCRTNLVIIKEATQGILEEDAYLQEVTPEFAQTQIRGFIKRTNQQVPKLSNFLEDVQLKIAASLKNLPNPILTNMKPRIYFSNCVNEDTLMQITKFAKFGLQFKDSCLHYQGMLSTLQKFEILSAYFLTQQEITQHYTPLSEWAKEGIASVTGTYDQCKEKSQQLQKDLMMEATALPEALKLYTTLSTLKSAHNVDAHRQALEATKERADSVLNLRQLGKTHFVEAETLAHIEKVKREVNKEISKLEELIAHAETKRLEFSTSYQVLSAQEIEKEAKASNFFIIIPTLPGSVFTKGQETIHSKSVFLGSNKTRKIPLSKAGKTNSRKGISPALSIHNEDSDQKINLLVDPALPTQLWKDNNGQFYISDVAKDKDYAYPLDTILAITLIPSSQGSSTPKHTAPAKI
jgi:hypothetical protein